MKARPSFSVLIPVYNGEKYITECLNSVLPQLGPDDEVLIHDDGSTDGTLQLLKQRYPKLNLSTDQNHGVSSSRNILANRASGDFLLFLDADDLMASNALSIFRNTFCKTQNHCGLTPILFFQDVLTNPHHTFYIDGEGVEFDPLTFFIQRTPPAASLIIPRHRFLEAGGFHPRLRHSEEFDLVLRLLTRGAAWKFLGQTIRMNRMHSGERASHNQVMCSWRSATLLHRLERGRYSIPLSPSHRKAIFNGIKEHGRILYRIGERRRSKAIFRYLDGMPENQLNSCVSLLDWLGLALGHGQSEKLRGWIQRIRGRNTWGQTMGSKFS